ncbi:MAG: hypothetical protein D6707_07360, partial [Bacteroidetes bacterium]
MFYNHQKEALKKLAPLKRGGLFFEMGLGKTRTAIALAMKKKCQRILVVCPLAVVNTWQAEVKKLQEEYQNCEAIQNYICRRIIGTKKQRLNILNTKAEKHFDIINYEGLNVVKDRLI